jgi:hypothetical protein
VAGISGGLRRSPWGYFSADATEHVRQ